jgi:predicted nucleic acid-binding Zn ribbon protein
MLSQELGNALSVAPVTVNSGRCRNSVGSRNRLRRRRRQRRRRCFFFLLLLLLLLLLTLGSDY